MSQQFKHLFSPIKIGTMTVRNRIVSTGHATYYDEPGTDLPTDHTIAYWVSKAKGGIGLICTRGHFIHRSSYMNTFANPSRAVQIFRKAADAIHQHGACVVGQIVHIGGQTQAFPPPFVAWSPSGGIYPRDWLNTHEITLEEIKEVISAFAEAAKVLREAGFDGVEMLGCHGYLITEFMSSFTNKRSDEYGGSLENRMRFPLEVIDAVREAVGRDYTVGMRVNGDEFVEGGYTLDDMLVMAPMLTRGGKLDYLSISAGTYRSLVMFGEPMYYPLGSVVYLASAIKGVVDVPVLARGRITDPLQAEEILANNQADMVCMTRAQIADPELANKAREGRLDEIRKCIGCNEGCFGRVLSVRHLPMRCTMNATIGRELLPGWAETQPAEKKKKVMIIGGGPAGLETARVAALRGHTVSLYDKGQELGGLTLIGAKAPGRDGLLDIGRYFTAQMKLLGVEVNQETEVTPELVKQKKPDVVVVAIGSLSYIPDIPGAEHDNVVEARDVLTGKAEVGQNVVVIAGEYHIQALSVADFIASQGKKVEILCEEYHAGWQLDIMTRHAVYQRLFQAGAIFSPCTGVRRISGNTVLAVNVMTRQERLIEGVDTVVIAFGGKENPSLYRALQGEVEELYAVGDCTGARKIIDAIADSSRLARTF